MVTCTYNYRLSFNVYSTSFTFGVQKIIFACCLFSILWNYPWKKSDFPWKVLEFFYGNCLATLPPWVSYTEKKLRRYTVFCTGVKIYNTLVKWFNATFKQKFLELSSFQKHAFVQKSPVEFSKTICCICGFMLSLSARDGHERTLNLMTWYDFIVRNKSTFFWKNIYDPEDIK